MIKEPDMSRPVRHTFVSQKVGYGGYTGLFDGKRVDEWNTVNIAYFNSIGNYLELIIDVTSNFYRSGTTGWSQRNDDLDIYRYDNGKYIKVTDMYLVPKVTITEKQWALFAKSVPPGRYKFQLDKVNEWRIDSEWFIEQSSPFLFSNEKLKSENNNITLKYDVGILNNGILPENTISLKQKIYTQDNVLLDEGTIDIPNN